MRRQEGEGEEGDEEGEGEEGEEREEGEEQPTQVVKFHARKERRLDLGLGLDLRDGRALASAWVGGGVLMMPTGAPAAARPRMMATMPMLAPAAGVESRRTAAAR